MKVEELKGKTYDQVSDQFDKELDEFKAKVENIVDYDTLKKMEDDLMKDMDDMKTYLADVKYPLAEGVDYDGEHFSRNSIATKIIFFLNKNTVEWSYTLGLFELVKLWKNKNFSEITYNQYDSTLRTLNQVKFTGFSEWRDILAVNEYLRSNHDAYTIDTACLLLLHQKHQVVLDRMQLVEQLENPNDDSKVGSETAS